MNKFRSIFLFGFLLLTSCKTYTIETDSFRNQLVSDSINIKKVEINNPLYYGGIKYSSNNIDSLLVSDKNGNKSYIKNSPSIELRITQQNGKKSILYFDTVILENDTLKGSKSRFAQRLTKQIPMDSIVKIEIQDGKKNFKYKK